MKRIHHRIGVLAVLALLVPVTGCNPSGGESDVAQSTGEASQVRIGYFPNLTHAPAIVGVDKGYFADHLGKTTLTPMVFSAGPAAMESLFSGAVDMIFVGPNPTVNGFVKSEGAALRVVAGAASGGAGLVVREGINSIADLEGKKIATPQLGNTQDVALRFWLKEQGLSADTEGGGDVSIMPQENSLSFQSFVSGELDGAWVPEPWLTRIIQDGGGHLLQDERDLWPDGQFVVTNLVVSADFLRKYPTSVRAVLKGEIDAVDFIEAEPDAAKKVVNEGIEKITGQQIDPMVLEGAWQNVSFTVDPLPATLAKGAQNASAVGFLDTVDLTGLYDLGPLNTILKERGITEVAIP